MSEYYLIHSAKGTTWSKKNHKYSQKQTIGGKINYIYKKGLNSYTDATKDNELIMDSSNYNEKMAQVAQTDEWKDIVRRQDPEYVRKNSDGTVTYLIDDYVAKKKHPVLDVLDDFANGRDLTVNKITKKSAVAIGDDYVKRLGSYLRLGVSAMLSGSKYRQGSYDSEISSAKTTAKNIESTANNSYGVVIEKYKKYKK